MRIKIYILILGLLSVFLGCTKAPALKVFTLEVPHVQASPNSIFSGKTIKVTYPQSLRENMSQKMNFSYSTYERGTYQNSEWSNHLSKLLQVTIIEVLDDSQLFKAVFSDTSSLKVNYRLESNIFAFEHRVRAKQSQAIISMQFTLIDGDTGKLLKSKKFSYKEPTLSLDAEGYVIATNRVLNRLSQDLLLWIK